MLICAFSEPYALGFYRAVNSCITFCRLCILYQGLSGCWRGMNWLYLGPDLDVGGPWQSGLFWPSSRPPTWRSARTVVPGYLWCIKKKRTCRTKVQIVMCSFPFRNNVICYLKMNGKSVPFWKKWSIRKGS